MKRLNRLAIKIGVVVALAVAIQVAIVVLMLGDTVRELRKEVDVGRIQSLGDIGQLDACDRDPEGWLLPDRGIGRVWVVRPDGTFYHPDAPKVRLAPLERAPRPGIRVVSGPEGSFPHWSVVETDRAGACHRFLVEPVARAPQVAGELRRHLFVYLSVIVLLSLAIALPLLRRIRKMRDATERVRAQGFEGRVPAGGDELGQLGAAFNDAARAARDTIATLDRREQVLRETLADLAHDVRTPLAALKLALSRQQASGDESAEGRAMRAEVEHLDAMFSNLAAMVQLEGSAIPLEPAVLDLGALAERVTMRLRVIAEDRDVGLEVAPPDEEVRVEADPLALEQALSNLLSNAIKFATRDVAVLAFAEGADAVLHVWDDGPGVDPGQLEALIQRRVRGPDSLDRGRPGQGLGLAIAHAFVQRMGGRLDLRRNEEGGALAEIRLPRLDVTEGASEGSVRVSQGSLASLSSSTGGSDEAESEQDPADSHPGAGDSRAAGGGV